MAKKKVTFTVEESILQTFKSLSEKRSINMSLWIENQMIKFVEKEVEYEINQCS